MDEFQPRTVAVLLVDDDAEDASLTRDLLHQIEGTPMSLAQRVRDVLDATTLRRAS